VSVALLCVRKGGLPGREEAVVRRVLARHVSTIEHEELHGAMCRTSTPTISDESSTRRRTPPTRFESPHRPMFDRQLRNDSACSTVGGTYSTTTSLSEEDGGCSTM
jgi:hypothetical protein